MQANRIDFFISYAGGDRPWAEWVAWQLSEAGYLVELDVWDWAAGQNFVLKINDALERAERVVALFSTAYFDRSRYTTDEWTASVVHGPIVGGGRLVPVRVEEDVAGHIPAVLRPLICRDLFGLNEGAARRMLLEAVEGPHRPDQKPVFPGQETAQPPSRSGRSGPRLPEAMPRVWNIPARNPGFTGRDGMLVAVRERLQSGDRAVVQALHGMGGVGKTQLAGEYAHQFARTYDLAWWINAEQGGLIGDQFASLGAALECVQDGADTETVRAAVLAELRERGSWLLIFDNAVNPKDITPWLPGGTGHVLITSRERSWAGIAVPVKVDVLARTESTAILRSGVTEFTDAETSRLAEHLGDLPLAIAQAAAYLAGGICTADEYQQLLATRAREILDKGKPDSYPRSLAAATQLAAERLEGENPAAADLLMLCAFLGPEPIPVAWLAKAASANPEPVTACAADPIERQQMLRQIEHSSLSRIDQGKLQIHRLTQAILRDRLSAEQADAARANAGKILVANNPGDIREFKTWPGWTRMVPHVLAVDPVAPAHGADLRDLACSASWYLLKRGDIPGSYALARQLRQQWRGQLSADDPGTLRASNCLALALRAMGRYEEARKLNQDTLDRRRHIWGDDDPDTLISAGALAADLRALGDVRAALELNQDNLARRQRALGPDHPDTLTSAACVARDLHALEEVQAARKLNEDTLVRRQRVLGVDHPSTLDTTRNLAANLRELGEIQAADELDRDTSARQQRIGNKFGSDHIQETEPEDVRDSS